MKLRLCHCERGAWYYKKQFKQKEREQKLVSRCLRRWSAQTGSVLKHQGEQYLELPRAICTPHGVPHKGPKSYATKYIEKRYCNLIGSMFPGGWVPDSVVLEGMFLINTAPLVTHTLMLLGEQKLVVSGREGHITTSGVDECCELLSNAEESDTRVWMHVVHSAGMKKLLFSPSPNHIGLSLDIPAGCVQLSSMSSPELRLLHFNNLLLSLNGDPDLALVPPTQRPRILQTLFLCDYISFFVGLGKATIMRHFFRILFSLLVLRNSTAP